LEGSTKNSRAEASKKEPKTLAVCAKALVLCDGFKKKIVEGGYHEEKEFVDYSKKFAFAVKDILEMLLKLNQQAEMDALKGELVEILRQTRKIREASDDEVLKLSQKMDKFKSLIKRYC
jgi:hypothetical protein